jgi:transposase-like protein
MTGIVRARYTLEFKQEAIRLVQGGQSRATIRMTNRIAIIIVAAQARVISNIARSPS